MNIGIWVHLHLMSTVRGLMLNFEALLFDRKCGFDFDRANTKLLGDLISQFWLMTRQCFFTAKKFERSCW